MICLNMILKDARETLRRTVESALPYIDSWVILDTGSTDGTQDLVRALLGHLPGELHEHPFEGFGPSRDRALREARSFLNQVDGAHVLILDSGSQVAGDLRKDLTQDGYFATVIYSGVEYASPRLLRARAPWSWRYRVHETLTGAEARESCGLEIFDYPSDSREKYEAYMHLSEADLADHPDDPRVWFYYAQNAFDSGHLVTARDAYHRRVYMGGWAEEAWYSALRVGQCHELLGDLRGAEYWYRKAHEMRPWRAEAAFDALRLDVDLGWSSISWPPRGDKLFLQRGKYATQAG